MKILSKLKDKLNKDFKNDEFKDIRNKYLEIVTKLEEDAVKVKNEKSKRVFFKNMEDEDILKLTMGLEIEIDSTDDFGVKIVNSELIKMIQTLQDEKKPFTIQRYMIDSIWKGFTPKKTTEVKEKSFIGFGKVDQKFKEKSKVKVDFLVIKPRSGPIRVLISELNEKTKEKGIDFSVLLNSSNWCNEEEFYTDFPKITKTLNVEESNIAEGKVFLLINGQAHDISQSVRQESKRLYSKLLKRKNGGEE